MICLVCGNWSQDCMLTPWDILCFPCWRWTWDVGVNPEKLTRTKARQTPQPGWFTYFGSGPRTS